LAAETGHVLVLQWAREHGCKWDGRTKVRALRSGCAETIQYVLDNGCPDEYEDSDSDTDSELEQDGEAE
jgi:hypothetical protein